MKKLSALQGKSNRLAILHPTEGDLGTWIEIRGPHSYEYRTALVEALKARGNKTEDDMTSDDSRNEAALVISGIVVDWDSEFFECDPTSENIKKVLSDPGNSWLINFIEAQLIKSEDFFGEG